MAVKESVCTVVKRYGPWSENVGVLILWFIQRAVLLFLSRKLSRIYAIGHQGSHLREKTAFFTQKKSRLRKSENAVRLLYAKNSDLTHLNAFSLFVFCTQQRRFVEHLHILDFPRPLPPPFPIASWWRDAGAHVTMFMTPIDTDHAHTPCVPQIKMQLDEVR